jgi:hypothetical protein
LTSHPGIVPDLQAGLPRLALLGAPGSGKTRLCSDLQAALAAAPAGTPSLLIGDDPPLAQLGPGLDRVLLMGLDLASGHTDRSSQRATDAQLRRQLEQAGLAYTVIYGAGAARLQNALAALPTLWPCSAAQPQPPVKQGPWVWACDSCSDPDCERRLFSALLSARRG